jgi:hypothetical protein
MGAQKVSVVSLPVSTRKRGCRWETIRMPHLWKAERPFAMNRYSGSSTGGVSSCGGVRGG